MSLEGTLGEQPLREVLIGLSLRRRTGILTVQGSREIIALSMLEGEVVSADALNQTLEDGLGKVLADLELVPPEDFAGLAAEHQAGGGRVGELVVERGFIDRPQLLGAIRQHTYRLCRQALAWRRGDFKFYQGEEVSFEPGLTPIPVLELLFRASRDLANPRLSAGDFPQADSVYARAAGVFANGEGTRGGERPITALQEYDDDARRLFSYLDGVAPVSELAVRSGLAEFQVTYLLHHWLLRELIERVEAAPARRPAPAPPVEAPPVEEVPLPAVEEGRPGLWRRWTAAAQERPVAWFGRVLGLALLFWLPLHLSGFPAGPFGSGNLLHSPHEALEALRSEELARHQIHRGAAAFFLLYGRYPEELGQLAELGLLREPAANPTESGRPRFSATAVSYVLRSAAQEGPGSAETGTIAGNFLLDPDFGLVDRSDAAPLVLLD